jgi:hypothetical protein
MTCEGPHIVTHCSLLTPPSLYVVTCCSVSRSLSSTIHHSLLPPHLFIPTNRYIPEGVTLLVLAVTVLFVQRHRNTWMILWRVNVIHGLRWV